MTIRFYESDETTENKVMFGDDVTKENFVNIVLDKIIGNKNIVYIGERNGYEIYACGLYDFFIKENEVYWGCTGIPEGKAVLSED